MGMKHNSIRATCMYRRYAYRDDHTREVGTCRCIETIFVLKPEYYE